MDELFEKTKEFLGKFEEILNKEFEKNEPTTLVAREEYDYVGELDYLFNELWEKESDYYLFGAGHQYENIRNCELKELTDKGIYFRFCKFKVYEKIYKERLSKFQEIYEDAEEIDFIENELEAFSKPIGSEEPFKYSDIKQKNDLTFTRKRTVGFLVQQAKTTGYNIIVSVNEVDGALSYVKEKIKNIPHSTLLESNSTINETKPPKPFDYLKIGALIAQGKLIMIKGGKYQYNGVDFNKQDITKQLESDLKIKSIRQYIEGTFGPDTDSTLSNDFLRNKKKIKNIVEYCLSCDIAITKDYQSLYDDLD
tara:strand:+ start:61 stop:987 length:927 start_codon:yes stop_codon:yes gene_type:complete